jgi:peptide alpha-N-acetyltransferase
MVLYNLSNNFTFLAYQRTGQYGESLKKCHEIDRHFTEIIEDQFDFHTYCMRKMTLKSYVGLLRLEDELRCHQFYEKCAKVAIETLLHLHEKPLQDSGDADDANSVSLDPSELKKIKNKAKKAKKKAEQEKAVAEQDKKRKDLHNKAAKKKADEDVESTARDELIAEKLARPEAPLDEAARFLEPLLLLARKKITTQLAAFEIYYHKGKILLMLQAILCGLAIEPGNFQLHGCLVRFLRLLETRKKAAAGGEDALAKVLSACLPAALQNKTAAELNKEFLARHEGDLAAVLVATRLAVRLDATAAAGAVQQVTRLEGEMKSLNRTVCLSILEALRAGEFGAEGVRAADNYRAACAQRFPLAVCFRDPAQPPPPPSSSPLLSNSMSSSSSNSSNENHVNHVLASQVEELAVTS